MIHGTTVPANDLTGFRPESSTPEEVVRRLGVDLGRGLGTEEASKRLETYGPNELPRQREPGVLVRFGRHLLEPMGILLLVAAAVAGVGLGDSVDAVAIAAIVLLNAVIATVQEGKAANAINSLKHMESLEVRVLRQGVVVPVPAVDLVAGDVVLLAAGDRIAADIRLVETSGLEVDESMLTGESLPVAKDASAVAPAGSALGDQRGMGFSGTIVSRGTARGVVVATGIESELGAIAGRLVNPSSPTPLQDELRRLTTVLGFAAIGVAGLSLGLSLLATGGGAANFERAFLFSVALAVAAVPEGLGTVVTVALAFGVRRMADRGAIVRQLAAVEGLGSTTVILTDKTGTLTENRLHLASLSADGSNELPESVRHEALTIAVLCNEATLDPPSGDPLELSFLEAAGAEFVTSRRSAAPVLATAPFDSGRKMMSTLHGCGKGFRLFLKGAPEEVLSRSTRVLDRSGNPQPLGAELRESILKSAGESANRGMRMLALARRDLDGIPADLQEAEGDLTFVALAALRDPPRAEAAASIARARDAGIEMLMLTGDHPGTGLAIARELGMAGDLTGALTGRQLGGSAPDDPMAVRVYARLDPEDKLNIVSRLQEMGHVVAVTGDGVNDTPALHQADIGVAMGRRGTQAAREAADIVITDDNLATIVEAVREGRGIYDNIRKVVEYILAANLAEITVVLGGLALFPAAGVPLLPLQLLWINLITDGLPAIGLGLDSPASDLMERRPRASGERLLDGRRFLRLAGRALLIAGGALAVLGITYGGWGHSWNQTRGMVFTTLALGQLFYSFALRGRRRGAARHLSQLFGNRWLVAGVFGGGLLQVGASLWAPSRSLLGVEWFSAADWALMGAASVVPALTIYGISNRSGRGGSGWRPPRHLLLATIAAGITAGAVAALSGRPELAGLVWAGTTLAALVPLTIGILRDLAHGKAGVDIIALLAMGGALAFGEHLAGAVVALMLAGGQTLEQYASGRARRELSQLVERMPRSVHRREGAGVVTRPLDLVATGDRLLVQPGEVVPVDGLVASPATLDESALTGESRPVEHGAGDRVASGPVNVGSPFDLTATATAQTSTYAGIVRLVRVAQESKAPFTRMADRYAMFFLPLTLLVSGLAWALSGDATRALSVLVVATPCPLILAAPVALVSGISRAAKRGVIVKGGGPLEALANARTLLVDKTGTLTAGMPSLREIDVFSGGGPDELLRMAAALEQVSPHAFAGPIIRGAGERSLPLVFPTETSEQPGTGVRGLVEGHEVRLGNAAWAFPGHQDAAALERVRRRAALDGSSTVFVGVENGPKGVLILDDPVRPDARRTLDLLRQMGIHRVVLVTGDNSQVAGIVGRQVGADEVLADRSPAEKVEAIRREGESATTLMVGDGINDAPALAAATVGIALGARGLTAHSEAADVVITVDRLDRVADAIGIARRAKKIALQSVLVGMGLSITAMIAAAAGFLTPLAGALLQEAIDVAVILNALRALGEGRSTSAGSTEPID